MTVVTDNSPLSALAEIEQMHLLQALFGVVTVPDAVARESCHPRAPGALRAFMQSPPAWIHRVPDPVLLPETSGLDPGESAAISLAWSCLPDVLLIVDDLPARNLCAALGIRCTGTAGVLLAAARRGLVEFDAAMSRLQTTRFRLASRVLAELRAKLADRS